MTSIRKYKSGKTPQPPIDQYWLTLRKVRTGVFIVLGSLAVTLIIPGAIAFRNGVFYAETMKERIPIGARVQLEKWEASIRAKKDAMRYVDSTLLAQARQVNVHGIAEAIQLRTQLRDQIDSAKPPIATIPFYLNPQMILWPAIYTTLIWLLCLVNPSQSAGGGFSIRLKRLLLLGTTTYTFYQWPLWLRNFVFNTQGRTVYAYPNYDIDPQSFVVQEAVIFGFCLMLAGLWLQWAQYSAVIHNEFAVPVDDPVAAALDPEHLLAIRRLFAQWCLASVILGGGFLFFTNFFWSLVAGYNDQRYLISALNAHLVWAISWGMISLPLLTAWRSWYGKRLKAIEKIHRDDSKFPDSTLKLVQEAKPFGQYAGTAAALSALTSFIFPLLQLIK